MELVTFDSVVYKSLAEKLDLMAKLLVSMGKTDEREQLLDTNELCALLKISKSTLQRMRSNYRIGYIKSGRKIYYRKGDVTAYLDSRRHEADG